MHRAGIAMIVAALLVMGCGTTQIITNDPDARIYVNGNMVGKGRAEVRKRGAPGSASILVKAGDGRRAETRMKRRFTLTTFIMGLYTYSIGLFTAWEYPDSVYVPLAEPAAARTNSWESGDDVWLAPPPGWQERAPAKTPAREPDPWNEAAPAPGQ